VREKYILIMNDILIQYKTTIIPQLKEQYHYKNIHAVPKLEKIVLNVGASKAMQDPKYYDIIESVLSRIAGQRPVKTKSKKSISNFKIREGMVVGYKVTLRGKKMYDFFQKLIHVTLPRVRDFRGVSMDSFDRHGNYSLGFREYIAFPEIKSDEIEKVHGVQVTIHTTAKTDEEGKALLSLFGFPFQKQLK